MLYVGRGKGKTSACLGQVLRALGHGLSVAMVQFIKRDGQAGEQKILKNLLQDRFRAGGLGFVRMASDLKPHREAACALLAFGLAQIEQVAILILDEVLYALEYALLSAADIQAVLKKARSCGCHLILSGRLAPDWLYHEADLVTMMQEVKHPHKLGQKAILGLDF